MYQQGLSIATREPSKTLYLCAFRPLDGSREAGLAAIPVGF